MSDISDLLQSEDTVILDAPPQGNPLTIGQLDEVKAQKNALKQEYQEEICIGAGPEYKNMLRKCAGDAERADLAAKFLGFRGLYADIRANIKDPKQLHGRIVLFGMSPDSVDKNKYAVQYHARWSDADRALREARKNGSFTGPVIAYQFHMQFGATDNYVEIGNFSVKNMPEPKPKGTGA